MSAPNWWFLGVCLLSFVLFFFFFFNDTATTEIYTLSLHDALPICVTWPWSDATILLAGIPLGERSEEHTSELQSHSFISYAVFCLKKKKKHYRLKQNLRPSATIPHTNTKPYS